MLIHTITQACTTNTRTHTQKQIHLHTEKKACMNTHTIFAIFQNGSICEIWEGRRERKREKVGEWYTEIYIESDMVHRWRRGNVCMKCVKGGGEGVCVRWAKKKWEYEREWGETRDKGEWVRAREMWVIGGGERHVEEGVGGKERESATRWSVDCI